MTANLNKPQLLLSIGMVLLAAGTSFCTGVPKDDQPTPDLVWAHGQTVLVFALFPACEDESPTARQTMQTLIPKTAVRPGTGADHACHGSCWNTSWSQVMKSGSQEKTTMPKAPHQHLFFCWSMPTAWNGHSSKFTVGPAN